ncbi:hypothetical protein L228DRAFT_211365 [Xylona heveae TC161]|uniref:Zn(2)-C6 fungal-type domain-containing protein n=1 Tax=Xylona heveae (strain CBS 132557 / TC161) TaxID=1328760 RepID=A0A165GL15_XYLHT|nr:hypothetical protein L228DRAFT_211365 [Xylona heveae TC161]KZF22320.1 hypothetical protein L228DRAFT_211365 [Xylona heveae TC161]
MSFSASRQSVGDDYFNDLSQQQQQPPPIQQDNPPRLERSESSGDRENGETLPRPKRIACILCRKRKLKCDGAKPSCSTCSRLKHDCAYDEARKKSGPKRGYVKALEARLAQVETLLKTQDSSETVTSASGPTYQDITPNEPMETTPDRPDFFVHNPRRSTPQESQDQFNQPFTDQTSLGLLDDRNFDLTSGGGSPWELMSLGLDEALPPQEVIDELHNIYFGKIHMSVPMVHRARYLAALNLAPHLRPPVCLRYAIWCIAASISEKYNNLSEIFYLRARRYAEYDQMKGHGEGILTVAHAQCWILIATYEFKLMYFPRAWLSVGKGGRMCQMMGLHRLDGKGLDVKQCLLPPRDWTEREERRRTFWMAFCEDRYASIGTGWPVLFEEKDILTNLPASEESYQMSRATSSKSLPSALDPSGAASLSSFAGVVVLACLFGRNLIHLHRPDDGDNDEDLNGPFWKRHRNMDNILLNTALSLPGHLRLPAGIADPNIIFLNMNIHTSTICLHQAAIFKADKNRMPAAVSAESKMRCLTAAAEIASIMRTVSHTDLSAMNPFMSFCLYVSARVFVQYLKARPEDEQFVASLRFLLSAMNVIKRQNPLTESFLAQLEVDLEAAGMDIRSGGDRVSVTRSPVRINYFPLSSRARALFFPFPGQQPYISI